MSRQHPYHCKHGKVIDPGHDSFGLEAEECAECRDSAIGRFIVAYPGEETVTHYLSQPLPELPK